MAIDSNVPAMTVTMVVCTIVSLAFMVTRFYCKALTGTRLGLDDYVLALSWALFVAFIALSIHTARFGLGQHITDIDLTLLPQALYLMPIGQFFAVLSVSVSKSSFIITLIRLVTEKWHKWLLYFALASINLAMLSISIVQFYQCGVPPTPGCIANDSVIALGIFAAAYSAAMDIVLATFPSLIIWKLQMQRREKVGIIIAMSLGVIAGVIGIYKSTTVPKVARNIDFMYGTAIVLIWLVAEVTATIMAASIPFFRPLLRKLQNRSISASNTSGKRSGGSYGLSSRSRNRPRKLGSDVHVNVVENDGVSDIEHDPLRRHEGNHGITRNTDFTVKYHYPHDDRKVTHRDLV